MRTILALAPLALAAACTHIDTGQIDYRIADAPGARTDRKLVACPDQGLTGQAAEMVNCRAIKASKVIRRYDPGPDGWRAFQKNDKYEITIEQGVIGANILEDRVFGKEFGTRAEIAILANVFEFAGPNDTDAAKTKFIQSGDIGQPDDPSDVEMKLVYFGDDIGRRQPFSFSNIPLKPRGTYNGGSIGLQIVIMEVDAKASNIKSLLGTLARFGQQALPGASETKDLLFDLGETIFSKGAKDDRLFEYRFVLSAPSTDSHTMDPVFSPGRYVLRRIQQRNVEMDWSRLRLDHNTGRLLQWVSAPKAVEDEVSADARLEEVREDLYMTVRIRPYASDVSDEDYRLENWEAFRGKIAEAAAADKSIATVTEDIGKMVQAQRTEQWVVRLERSWATAETKLRAYTLRITGETDLAGCAISQEELNRQRDIAQRDAKDALTAFVRLYQSAAAAKDGGVSAEKREPLISKIARYFMPWQGEEAASFENTTVFDKTFIADAGLIGVAMAKASKGRERTTCEDLVALGFAARVRR